MPVPAYLPPPAHPPAPAAWPCACPAAADVLPLPLVMNNNLKVKACLDDGQLVRDADGYITVVAGPTALRPATAANFLPTSVSDPDEIHVSDGGMDLTQGAWWVVHGSHKAPWWVLWGHGVDITRRLGGCWLHDLSGA